MESVAEDVHELAPGDTVLPIFLPDCAECTDCQSNKSNLCSKFPFHVASMMPRDGTSRFTDLKGETLFHFIYTSSFSEYTVVDVASETKIDPAIPPNRACLLSCGVSTGNSDSCHSVCMCVLLGGGGVEFFSTGAGVFEKRGVDRWVLKIR